MKLTHIALFRYHLPLIEPLQISGREIIARAGLLIRLQAEGGHCGWGEIAPFPRLHREVLAAAEAQTRSLRKNLIGQRLPPLLPLPGAAFETWLGKYRLFPSVRYGVETAALNLLANAQGKPLAALLSPRYRSKVSVNALLSGSLEVIKAQLPSLVANGYKAIKLKVGKQKAEDDAGLVREVRAALPAPVSLRLDANRAWQLEEALSFGKAIRDCRIEYIEEPLRDPSELKRFYAETGLPLALDETLAENSPGDFRPFPGLAALILKPSVIGGFARTLQLARLAAIHQLKAVISSVFSSGVGLAAEAALAACVNAEDVPAGLDTCRWLAEDLLAEDFPLQNGQIEVEEAFRRGQVIRMEKLERI